MTIASVIIQSAYREGNLIAAGTSPTTAEVTEALARLNAYIKGVFGFELGENLADWMVPGTQRVAGVAANYPQLPRGNDLNANTYPYPPANVRIVWGCVTGTVYFPGKPDDGARMAVVQGSGAGDSGAIGQTLTLNGNGRTIEGLNTKTFTSAAPVFTPREWMYRADLGDWVAIVPLASGDEVPFPVDFEDFWTTALALRLAPRYGKVANPLTVATFKNMLAKFKARYRQKVVTTYGSDDFPNTNQSYRSGFLWA